MKKILLILAILFVIGTVVNEAAAQPPHARAWGKNKHNRQYIKRGHYYYYPSANVYYSPVARRYWYPRNGVWINTGILPPSVVVYNHPNYMVYRDMDDDIWRDNRAHINRYRRYPAPVLAERRRGVRTSVSVNLRAIF